MEMDLNLGFKAVVEKVPRKTPLETKRITACRVYYEDGSELDLPVEDDQGFHRINEYISNGRQLVIHEVFITYGHT